MEKGKGTDGTQYTGKRDNLIAGFRNVLVSSGGSIAIHAFILLLASSMVISVFHFRRKGISNADKPLPRELKIEKPYAFKDHGRPIMHLKKDFENILFSRIEPPMPEEIPKGSNTENMSDKNLSYRYVHDNYGLHGIHSGPYGERYPKNTSSINEKPPDLAERTPVEKALKWLAAHQDGDGKWSAAGFSDHCSGVSCNGVGSVLFDLGITGLAVLAFVREGYTHREGRYRKTIRRALKYILESHSRTGVFGTRKGENWIYNHLIATMALTELYGATDDYRIRPALGKAVKYILNVQNPGLGWRYESRSGNNDTNVTGWAVLTLLNARAIGFDVPEKVFKDAKVWFDRVTASNGRTGYLTPRGGCCGLSVPPRRWQKQECLTGLAITCRIATGENSGSDVIRKGVDLIMQKMPQYDSPNFMKVNHYHWHFATLALKSMPGTEYDKWKRAVTAVILQSQRKNGCAAGSWDPVGEWGMTGGRVYATAINALTLQLVFPSERARFCNFHVNGLHGLNRG